MFSQDNCDRPLRFQILIGHDAEQRCRFVVEKTQWIDRSFLRCWSFADLNFISLSYLTGNFITFIGMVE